MRTEWLAPFLTFTVCWLTLAGLLRRGRLPLDHPNARSLHSMPTPRIGGLGIMAGVLVGTVWLADARVLQITLPVMLAATALAAVSVLDDVRGLPVAWRFLAHFVAAGACLLGLGLGGWALLAGILAVVWMTNLYNFMDGSDGLAGGMAAIGFGALALTAWLGDASGLAAFSAAIAAAALAFLRFNFPPARVFMGDAGSIPLGFLAASLGLVGVIQGLWPMWFPIVVFAPFIVDATVTLFRRLLQGEKVWRAHRSHYYQRLVQMGWGHRRTALVEYALMGLTGVSAVWALKQPPAVQNAIFAVLGLVYISLMVWLDRKWSAFVKRHSGDIVCE